VWREDGALVARGAPIPPSDAASVPGRNDMKTGEDALSRRRGRAGVAPYGIQMPETNSVTERQLK
jgi:hypothetical protein